MLKGHLPRVIFTRYTSIRRSSVFAAETQIDFWNNEPAGNIDFWRPIPRFWRGTFISQNMFIRSFCKSQFPHKSAKISFVLVIIKDMLTDLYGNWLLQNNFVNTVCEIRVRGRTVDNGLFIKSQLTLAQLMLRPYLVQIGHLSSVPKEAPPKSIPSQIRQLILYY